MYWVMECVITYEYIWWESDESFCHSLKGKSHQDSMGMQEIDHNIYRLSSELNKSETICWL